jgi:hypothetical protein
MSEDNSNKKFKKFKLDIAPDVDLEVSGICIIL